MIKLTASFEWHNKESIQLELEHIGQLIMQGYTSGEGWEITGEEEKEKVIQIEDKEELSECCGAEINEMGLCSDCKEHIK